MSSWSRSGPWVREVPYHYKGRELRLRITIKEQKSVFSGDEFSWSVGDSPWVTHGYSASLSDAKRDSYEVAKIHIKLYARGATGLFPAPPKQPEEINVATDTTGCPICGSPHGVCMHPVDEVRKTLALLMRIPRAT